MNLSFHTLKIVCEHLYFHGFDCLTHLGVGIGKMSIPHHFLMEFRYSIGFMDYRDGNTIYMINDAYKDCVVDPKAFKELLEQDEKLLYLGYTNFTKLGTLVTCSI